MEAESDVSQPAAPDLGALFREHVDDVFAYASRRVGRDAAAEITAETFRIAWERIATFDADRGGARPWLFGIASNLIRGHWRTERRHLRALRRAAHQGALETDPLDRVTEQVDAEQRLVGVLAELERLSPADRDVVVLYAWERLSYEEIAVALDIPVGTVRSRLHRSRGQITSSERQAP